MSAYAIQCVVRESARARVTEREIGGGGGHLQEGAHARLGEVGVELRPVIVCVCVCACVFTFTYLYTYNYIFMYVHIYIHIHTHMCVCVSVRERESE